MRAEVGEEAPSEDDHGHLEFTDKSESRQSPINVLPSLARLRKHCRLEDVPDSRMRKCKVFKPEWLDSDS